MSAQEAPTSQAAAAARCSSGPVSAGSDAICAASNTVALPHIVGVAAHARTMTKCEAAGCIAPGVEEVPVPPMNARTRDDPEYVATTETARMCVEHATLCRRIATAPYLLRVIPQRGELQEVLDRLDAAEAGRAEPSDLTFLDTYLDDWHQLALIIEGAADPTWQALAAEAEALSDSLQPKLRRHLI